jgi:hypothetical protein
MDCPRIQAKLDKPFKLNSCWKNMGVDFTVQLSDIPRKAVKNIDWIGLGQLGTCFIICARFDEPFFKLVPNFCQKLLNQSDVVPDKISASSSLHCILDFWCTCCCVYLHNSSILGLYVVYSESYAVSSFHLKTSPRSHFIYCIAENSCSQDDVDPKNDNAANSNPVIIWNNLAMSSTHI